MEEKKAPEVEQKILGERSSHTRHLISILTKQL